MTLPTDLRAGVDVLSRDGEKLGTLKRVVLKHTDLSLTHLVVDVGFLRSGRKLWEGGLGLEYDRIVPVEAMARADDDAVRLELSAAEFRAAPEYSEERFEPPRDVTPDEFDIPDVANRIHALAGALGHAGAFWLVEKRNRPPGSVEVREGTDVWRLEPHQKLGDVARVLFDDQGRVRAFVVRRGFILKRDVILPVRYVSEVMDDLVRVDITDDDLDRLREYEEA